MRVLTSIHTNSRSPLLLANRNYNEGVHFVEYTGFSVMSKVSRLQMNLYEALAWNSESASYADLGSCNNYMRLLDNWRCNNDLWLLDHWRCNNDLRFLDHWLLYNNLWL